MALKRITEEEMNAQGVVASPDILSGTPAQNKAIFDRMVRNLVAPTFNACVDAVEAVEKAQQIINANEQVRNEAEAKRIEQESDRVTAENQRATAENERKTAEDGRKQAETERAAAETKRANEESTRVNAETLRVNAETDRNQAEENRILRENERVDAESKRAIAEQSRNSNETERSVEERKRTASEVDRALAEKTRESNETERKSAEEARKSAEEQRDAAERAREDNTAGIVAQATEQANKAQSSAEAAEEAKKAAEAARDAASEIVGGDFASKTEAKGYAEQEVSAHNVDIGSHNDIRLLIEGLTTRLNALADSDDTTLDQMSEIVAYIKANKTLIDSITTSKVSVSDIVNNLTTNVSNKPLSAAQGVVLKTLIDSLSSGKLDVTKIMQTTGNSESEVMSQKAVTDELTAMGGGVPDYVVEEAEATLAKAASHGVLGRTIRFVAISDTHEDSEQGYNAQITVSNRHAGQAIAYIAARIGLDFIAHLGDVSSAGSFLTEYQFATLRKDLENINKFLSPGAKGLPNVRLVGNHDQFYTTDGTRLFNSGAYNYFGRFCEGNKDTVGGYGYFDLDSAKVRVIYLNTSDVPSATTAGTLLAMTDAQKNWLCKTLIDLNEKDDAADWKILILSHAPLDFGSSTNIATDILLAYVNGESYGDYVFTNHDAQIISNVHGHVHCYSYGYMAEKIRRFTIPNACFIGNNHYGSRSGFESWVDTETYHKTANTGKDTAFSLVTIDLDSGTCYVDNYGAGIDRVFSTDYKPSEAVVPTEISDITYSGATTVGATIDTLAFKYTVSYSDGTSAEKTSAVVVSPATIGAVGDNSVTVSYTEDGTTVSATMTIVGTAAPVERLLSLNRTYVSGTAGESITDHLDESRAYLNVPYDTGTFDEKSCTASDILENSVTVKEPGVGGVCIAYPLYLSDIATQAYQVSFDYSGAGKARAYYRLVTPEGKLYGVNNLVNSSTAGASGHIDAEIPAASGFEGWLVLFFGSNTSGTSTFTNVSLTKVE